MGRQTENKRGGWDPGRGGVLTGAGENLPPLRFRPLGPTLATARGPRQLMIIRYADDIVVGFQQVDDAKRFHADMQARLARFALALHAEKTRLIEFGKYAAEHRAGRGERRPETFNFLGFTHV